MEDRLRAAKLASLVPAKRKALLAASKTPKAKRTEMQKALVAEFARYNTVTLDEIDRSLDARTKARRLDLRRRIAALEKVRQSYGMIQALWDVGPAPPTYIFNRGDFQNPGPEIAPGVIAVLDDPAHPFQLPAAGPHGSTGYRTAFAKWLTSDRHPLTARVYVNRLWMHHFGRGIVPTPDNFGASGLPPSHPELLDWLAREFIASGWDVKHIQRLIVKSAAYQQASRSCGRQRERRPREALRGGRPRQRPVMEDAAQAARIGDRPRRDPDCQRCARDADGRPARPLEAERRRQRRNRHEQTPHTVRRSPAERVPLRPPQLSAHRTGGLRSAGRGHQLHVPHEFSRRFTIAGTLERPIRLRPIAPLCRASRADSGAKRLQTNRDSVPHRAGPIAFDRRNKARRHAPPGTDGTTQSRFQTDRIVSRAGRSVPDDFEHQ